MKQGEEELRRIGDLKRLRDELRVQAHLGKAEAKDAWSRLEASWPDIEEKLKVIESETSGVRRQPVRERQRAGGEIAKDTASFVGRITRFAYGVSCCCCRSGMRPEFRRRPVDALIRQGKAVPKAVFPRVRAASVRR